ncbi:kinase-like domain-containing protein [Cokeromyces recurvatus]|uniref:kinase-like domain-containing protein n=1 Tax=Cokeromyces recurvatus TaxID=90255 RepID=UPI00221E6899|nr:kinase-like domain-containing protein [Cokeromyces recurvatus]KAI7897878.1 kinase-like domain-containing protein [Cokeromyces recurvatus]
MHHILVLKAVNDYIERYSNEFLNPVKKIQKQSLLLDNHNNALTIKDYWISLLTLDPDKFMRGWKPTQIQFDTLYDQLFHHYFFQYPIEIKKYLPSSFLWFPPQWFEQSKPVASGRMGQVYITQSTKRRNEHYHQLVFVSMAAESTLEQLIPQVDQWSFQKIFKMALMVATAVKKLHQRNQVHPNLQPKNCMIFPHQDYITLVDDWFYPTHNYCYGRYPYIAPEIRLTEKANMYSLGIILWQLATGVIFPVSAIVIPSIYKLTSISHFMDPAYEQLIIQCLHSNPDMRPTADQVCKALIRIIMTDRCQNDDDNNNNRMACKKSQHASEVKNRQWIIAKYLGQNNEDMKYMLCGASISKRIMIQTIFSFKHHLHSFFTHNHKEERQQLKKKERRQFQDTKTIITRERYCNNNNSPIHGTDLPDWMQLGFA